MTPDVWWQLKEHFHSHVQCRWRLRWRVDMIGCISIYNIESLRNHFNPPTTDFQVPCAWSNRLVKHSPRSYTAPYYVTRTRWPLSFRCSQTPVVMKCALFITNYKINHLYIMINFYFIGLYFTHNRKKYTVTFKLAFRLSLCRILVNLVLTPNTINGVNYMYYR